MPAGPRDGGALLRAVFGWEAVDDRVGGDPRGRMGPGRSSRRGPAHHGENFRPDTAALAAVFASTTRRGDHPGRGARWQVADRRIASRRPLACWPIPRSHFSVGRWACRSATPDRAIRSERGPLRLGDGAVVLGPIADPGGGGIAPTSGLPRGAPRRTEDHEARRLVSRGPRGVVFDHGHHRLVGTPLNRHRHAVGGTGPSCRVAPSFGRSDRVAGGSHTVMHMARDTTRRGPRGSRTLGRRPGDRVRRDGVACRSWSGMVCASPGVNGSTSRPCQGHRSLLLAGGNVHSAISERGRLGARRSAARDPRSRWALSMGEPVRRP